MKNDRDYSDEWYTNIATNIKAKVDIVKEKMDNSPIFSAITEYEKDYVEKKLVRNGQISETNLNNLTRFISQRMRR